MNSVDSHADSCFDWRFINKMGVEMDASLAFDVVCVKIGDV